MNGASAGGVSKREEEKSTVRSKWLTRRETWLVVLGVVLHAVYMLSIFDIYFKSPIVHGMDLVEPRLKAPAKRVVLLVADGLRADKCYEMDSEGNYRAPFLRKVIENQGRWGVSHARPPTESRPGHVSIIAGFYEDPSAVTKGWKANPVEFDSVFNRSRHTFAFGSPDIVPIFCGALPHSTWNAYPPEYEDFASDASILDEWSFDQFQSLFNRSYEDPKLKELLHQDEVVIFLHMFGCDSNGHSHRPHSSVYHNNVKVVDHIAAKVYQLLEDYYGDSSTAYIFTADHGMSDKGSHGDGHPSNTEVPLVAWGAGIRYPTLTSSESHAYDEIVHEKPTPPEWGLKGIERVDVYQADIAPLMSTLLGLPCPSNSVGNLPEGYIRMAEVDEVEAVLANTKQILNQFLRKSQIKQSNAIFFKPFKPLANASLLLDQIEDLILSKHYGGAMKLSKDLRSLAMEGLNYFQTYDWLKLMAIITLGYVGWMVFLVLHVLQSYTSLPRGFFGKEQSSLHKKDSAKVYLGGSILMAATSVLMLLEQSPLLYHAYAAMTVYLWMKILSEHALIRALWRYLSRRKSEYVLKLVAVGVVSALLLELLVHSFTERKLYTWCFLIVGILGSVFLHFLIPWNSGIPVYFCFTCWFLSIFTLMPAEIPYHTELVIASGAIIILTSLAANFLDNYVEANRYWRSICACNKRKPGYSMLYCIQILLVGLSSIMVLLSTSHRIQNQKLHSLHQITNWLLAAFSMVLPLISKQSILSRLNSIYLGFAPPFLLLSIGYEAVFYSAFALVLFAWILFENAILYSGGVETASPSVQRDSGKRYNLSRPSKKDNIMLGNHMRDLKLSDVRMALTFMVLFNVAFFGTGNFASIASFEISSVYRFITIFSPFLMAALLIFKLLIPFMLVICTFSALTKLLRVPRLGLYFLVIFFSDVMTIHFFFLVRNTGSWMEIGNTISHFGIMSAQVVFVLLLFALTNAYTKDFQIQPWKLSESKTQ